MAPRYIPLENWKQKAKHHIYPRAHALRHEVVVHGHGEGHGWSSGRLLLSFVIHNILSLSGTAVHLPTGFTSHSRLSCEALSRVCLPYAAITPECSCSTFKKLPVALSLRYERHRRSRSVAYALHGALQGTPGTASASIFTRIRQKQCWKLRLTEVGNDPQFGVIS